MSIDLQGDSVKTQIRYDSKRLLAGKSATEEGRFFGFPSWLFFTWIPLPVCYGVMRGSTVDALIALGFIFIVGCLLARAYAVRCLRSPEPMICD